VRLAPGRSRPRIVVDRALRLPLDANVLADGAAPTLIATSARWLERWTPSRGTPG